MPELESYSALQLNGQDVCFYEIKNGICFMKILVVLPGKTEQECEDLYAYQIGQIESDPFTHTSYLNV